MTKFRGTGITIVPTKTDLPSAADFPGIGVIQDVNKIVISDGSSWDGGDSVTPEYFGCKGDGITDDSAGMLAAITYCSQNGVPLISSKNKQYKIGTTISLNRTGHKQLNVDFNGSTLLFNNTAIRFTLQTSILTTTLTAEVSRGQNYLDLSSVSGITVGDLIEITCPIKSGPDHSDSLHYYVVHEILGNRLFIDGVTVSDITIANIVASGNVGDINSFVVKAYHLNEPIVWKNTKVKITDVGGTLTGAFDIQGCSNVWLDKFNVEGHCRTQIYIRYNAYDIVSNSYFESFGYTNDIGTVAPLVSGTPNEYGYGILRERNWISKTSNCVGKRGWHAFDDTYGQMHSFYSDCVTQRCSGGFSTHNGVWNVYYDNCTTIGQFGFNSFRACFVTLKNCKHFGNDSAVSLSAVNHEVLIENCNFELDNDSANKQVLSIHRTYTSSNLDPRSVNPSAISAGFAVKWILRNNVIASIQTGHGWSFGVDNVNTNSVDIIEGNRFHNACNWSGTTTYGQLHHISSIRNNIFTGSISGQFLIGPPVYPTSAGAVWTIEGNIVDMSSVAANNSMIYIPAPTTNFTVNFINNTLKGMDGLVRCNNAGTLNIDRCEGNNVSNKLIFHVSIGGYSQVNITNLYGNIYNNSTGISNITTNLTVTNTYGNINKAFQISQPTINWSANAPTTGTYKVGDIIYNITPAKSNVIGWECIVAGTPGTWKEFGNTQSFIPSIYTATKSATTTVSGQSEAKATGSMVLKVQNLSTTNGVYIGLGQSNIEAESNSSTGSNNITRFLVPQGITSYINISDYSYYSWLGNGATVSTILTQGV